MTRKKRFDPAAVQASFWRRDDVRLALARHEIGHLFVLYLRAHGECTQSQLALLTEHDRSDISNFVRGTRSPRVGDIDVLGRIADGLAMPDEARVLLGLAPMDMTMSQIHARTGSRPTPLPPIEVSTSVMTGWYRPSPTTRPLRLAICGSRAPGVDDAPVDRAIHAVSRLLMNRLCQVIHGPVGVGMEVMTYIADHYRPPTLHSAVGVFGRANVVRDADVVLIIGGGHGTLDEFDLAVSMNKPVIPLPRTGGAARHAFKRMGAEPSLRAWLPDDSFAALDTCEDAEDITTTIETILADLGSTPRE